MITYLPKQRAVKETLTAKRRSSSAVRSILAKGVRAEDITIKHNNLPLKPYEVGVENSHDYKDLLFMVLEMVYSPEKMAAGVLRLQKWRERSQDE